MLILRAETRERMGIDLYPWPHGQRLTLEATKKHGPAKDGAVHHFLNRVN